MPGGPFLRPARVSRVAMPVDSDIRPLAEQVNGGVVTGTDDVAGPLRVLCIDVPDAATGNVDRVLPVKMRVVDAWLVKIGGAGNAANSYQLFNGPNAITGVITGDLADKQRVSAGDIDPAFQDIAHRGVLRVTRTKGGGNAACQFYVAMVPVA